MSERYEHLILPLSSHSSSALCLCCHLRRLCAHTTYRAIFAATIPLRVLLSHTTIAHRFRMFVSQSMFACHARALASALLFSNATVPLCLLMLCSHANFVHFLRTIFLQEIVETNSRMLLSYATFARHFSHVTFSCYFRTLCSHARSHIVFQTLLSQAQCARYLGTLGSHTIFARYPSFANTFPTLGLEPLPHPLNASGGTGRRPLQ